MLEPMPARAADPIIWVTSTGPSVGTICAPAPLKAWEDARYAVFRFMSGGMAVLDAFLLKAYSVLCANLERG